MPLPLFYHVGNAGGLSFVRAVTAMNAADGTLIVNNETDLALALPRLRPDSVARLAFAFGHHIHLAEPWVSDRYEITMLRWPQAAFCADSIYAHEHPPYTAVAEIWGIADHHDRLRAYLDHLGRGGINHLMSPIIWLNFWRKLTPKTHFERTERQALVDTCDALLRDRYDLVGITELMDETLFLFQADFPDRKVAPWVRKRENKQRADPFSLPPDIVARFEHESEADITLYNRARRRLIDRFAAFWLARPDMRQSYLAFKTATILSDAVVMARFAAADPLYFPPELPLEELRACVVSQLDRAHEIRASVMRAYG